MKIVWLFMCLLALQACEKGKKKKEDEKQPSRVLKIMTYNIHHGTPIHHDNNDVQLEGIAAVINAQKPDLVALQEVDSVTERAPFSEAEELAAMTGMHAYFSRSIPYQGGGYGVAVLSRFPIQATKRYMLPMPDPSGEPRSLAVITVTPFPGFTMDFASAHLDLVTENRQAQVEKLVDISKASAHPLVVAGDLNATTDSKEILTLQKEYVAACVTNCPLTFPSDDPVKAIDYIVLNPQASKAFHIVSYNAVLHVQASDHLPLLEYLTKQ
jgi:endonuclease/exonuclease/phosphatase family metal-dependent hydrolase